jgi:hypothetical protein
MVMNGNVSEGCLEASVAVSRSLTVAILAFLIVLAVPNVGTAQVLYSSIVGTVTDTSGAVVPGATVTFTN